MYICILYMQVAGCVVFFLSPSFSQVWGLDLGMEKDMEQYVELRHVVIFQC
jgi:hypothetical protein